MSISHLSRTTRPLHSSLSRHLSAAASNPSALFGCRAISTTPPPSLPTHSPSLSKHAFSPLSPPYSAFLGVSQQRLYSTNPHHDPYERIEGEVAKEEKKRRFRWPKPMSRKMLQLLAQEVENGNRPNNYFKPSSFVNVAKCISEEFEVKCMADHVENHMRTLRTKWTIICKLKGNSEFGWDDNLKMVTASPKVLSSYSQEFPSHERYLNHEIDMFDELAIVFGEDMGNDNMAKSFGDIESGSSIHVDDNSEQAPTKSGSTSSEPRQSRKRSQVEEEGSEIQQVFAQLREVVILHKFSSNRLDVDKLYGEMMKMTEFEETTLADAFDYLVDHEMQAKAFLVKSTALRSLWLSKFEKTI